jgi:hypothetical protein
MKKTNAEEFFLKNVTQGISLVKNKKIIFFAKKNCILIFKNISNANLLDVFIIDH